MEVVGTGPNGAKISAFDNSKWWTDITDVRRCCRLTLKLFLLRRLPPCPLMLPPISSPLLLMYVGENELEFLGREVGHKRSVGLNRLELAEAERGEVVYGDLSRWQAWRGMWVSTQWRFVCRRTGQT